MDQDDPEKRIAELERHSVEQKRIAEPRYQQAPLASRPGQASAPRSSAFGSPRSASARRRDRYPVTTVATLIATALVLFWGGADEFRGYFTGTPTTAMVTGCSEGSFREGDWRIGGC